MVRTSPIENIDDADKKTNDSEALKVSSSSSDVANLKKRGKGKKKRNSLNLKTSTSIKWEVRINELILYKEKNGNYNVPQRRKIGLGDWVLH